MALIKSVRTAETIQKEGLHRVDGVKRLYLQVSWRQKGVERAAAHGVTRSWVFRYLSPITGKVVNMGLGSASDIGLAKAKELALAAAEKRLAGRDPLMERDQAKEAAREAYRRAEASKVTFADVAKTYLQNHLADFRNEKHKWQWARSVELINKSLGDLNVAEIDTGAVVKFLTPIWAKTPETASRIRGRIEKILAAAKALGLRSGDNPARWDGHLETLFGKVPQAENHEAMPFADVPAFMAQLRERDGISARALEFLILTATRTTEARAATWAEIDLDKRLWVIPASRMKAAREHSIPLSDRAVAILKALPRLGDYVFPGQREGKPLSDFTMRHVLHTMVDPSITVHGFRSSFRDWAGDHTQFDRETIEHSLAHKLKDKVEASYRRGSALQKRELLMQAWGNYCAGLTADNVVALHG